MSVKILAVGDVCGEPGLTFLSNNLKNYRKEKGIDFVVVISSSSTARTPTSSASRPSRRIRSCTPARTW